MQKFIPYYVKIREFNIYLLLDRERRLIANSVPIKDRDIAWSIFSEIVKTSIGISVSKDEIHIGRKYERKLASIILSVTLGITNVINRNLYRLILPQRYVTILELLRKIPRGKVTTYSSIARFLGVHPRQVGITLKKNPLPIVYPCHRVIRSDGSIGGYIGSKYQWLKRELLIKEGINIVKNRVPKHYMVDISEINLSRKI